MEKLTAKRLAEAHCSLTTNMCKMSVANLLTAEVKVAACAGCCVRLAEHEPAAPLPVF